jgi:hypothetical protein
MTGHAARGANLAGNRESRESPKTKCLNGIT